MQFEFWVGELVFTINKLKNEELVLFLFPHDQVLATDDSQPSLILWVLKSNDLIWLPSLCGEKCHWDLTTLDERGRVEHENLINFGHKKNIILWKLNGCRSF
jgi:hypothetical protein